MKITVLTLFPEMYEGFLNSSIITLESELADSVPALRSKSGRYKKLF